MVTVLAGSDPVRLFANTGFQFIGEIVTVHQRHIVTHGAGHTEGAVVGAQGNAVVGGIVHIGFPGHQWTGQVRQLGQTQHFLLFHVVLDKAVQKRQLEVEITLICRVRHGPHCGAQVAVAGRLQIGFQIQRFNNFQAVGIHYLKHPLPLGRIQQVLAQQGIGDAAQQLAVQRGVHGTDTGVINALAVLGVDIFVGRVTGRELALLFTGFHIENMDHIAG